MRTVTGIGAGAGAVVLILLLAWYALSYVQVFLSYGTAYRLAKNGGDNGVSLFGWMLVMNLASLVPGLGIYLWYKYRHLGKDSGGYGSADQNDNGF